VSQRAPEPSGPAGLTPDEVEQRQRPDGTFEDEEALADAADLPDHPLTADEIEQRQVVEEDEDDRRDG
jgi:hypothetical protein